MPWKSEWRHRHRVKGGSAPLETPRWELRPQTPITARPGLTIWGVLRTWCRVVYDLPLRTVVPARSTRKGAVLTFWVVLRTWCRVVYNLLGGSAYLGVAPFNFPGLC